ncbi:MAG: sulfatase-like hydrolase/transferase [Litorilinea sp.]
MQPTNFLFICSDEHQRNITGCYGNPHAHTPHMDALAARGVRFDHAYTPSPICVPARAALASGQPIHATGHWDNAFPYTGTPRGWGHHLAANGFVMDSIGKLHFRKAEDDNGFRNEVDAMYVAEGIGEVVSCLRARAPHRGGRKGVISAGPGESPYLDYDRRIAQQAATWLADHANADGKSHDAPPWALFVSFVNPHPPFKAPPELYAKYDHAALPLPHQWQQSDWPEHSAFDYFRQYFGWQEPIAEADLRRVLATYYAQCEFVDQQVGRLLAALERQGLAENTRVIYTSDHGAMLGARGLFGKFSLYDEAAAIPLILAGPDIPQGKVVKTPVSLLDCGPTVVEALGCPPQSADLPGESLLQIATAPDRPRYVLSEYHAAGSLHGAFMLSDGHYKYNHYVHMPPQLFDLHADPAELVNRADDPAYAPHLARMDAELRRRLDPLAIDARAKADQLAKVEEHGGEAAVLARGLSNSPIPGQAPVFTRNLKATET